MDEPRALSWRRRDFLVATAAGLAVPLSLGFAASPARAGSLGASLLQALTRRDSASIGYWQASETLPDLSGLSLPIDAASFSQASTMADGGIVSARRIASSGIGSEAQIRVAGYGLPKSLGHEKRSISLDVLFDTAHGRLPVHALHVDCSSCNGGGSGGAMVLPVRGGRLAIRASTSEQDQTVLEIPARRGVYVVGWRDPRTGVLPRWRSVRMESHNESLRLVTSLGREPEFSYAVLTLDHARA